MVIKLPFSSPMAVRSRAIDWAMKWKLRLKQRREEETSQRIKATLNFLAISKE